MLSNLRLITPLDFIAVPLYVPRAVQKNVVSLPDATSLARYSGTNN